MFKLFTLENAFQSAVAYGVAANTDNPRAYGPPSLCTSIAAFGGGAPGYLRKSWQQQPQAMRRPLNRCHQQIAKTEVFRSSGVSIGDQGPSHPNTLQLMLERAERASQAEDVS